MNIEQVLDNFNFKLVSRMLKLLRVKYVTWHGVPYPQPSHMTLKNHVRYMLWQVERGQKREVLDQGFRVWKDDSGKYNVAFELTSIKGI